MDTVPPALLQFVFSLLAILALAGLAWWLKLGAEPRLADEEAARAAAQEVIDGYAANEVAIDTQGRGALLRDDAGQVMLLRPHGSHFAGRVLTGEARARLEGDKLTIDTGERRFGAFVVSLGNAQDWANRINAIGSSCDA